MAKCGSSDDTLFAYDLARKECRAARKALPTNTPPKIHAILASAKTVNAVTQLSRTDRRIAATHEQWDTNLETLNTPGGIVDLCTGIILPHNPLDYCTKITSVAPAPVGTKCPIWTSFLSKIMQGEEEIIQFLQRVVGYALTGLTIEHAMFFLYGKGANGKGTFLNALTTILGDYAIVAPIDTFTASTSERHPTDLAMLRGARLVASQETDEGRRWAEAKIKALTGGDPISARFMRQDFFTYFPQFKLLVAGNHKPALQGVDEAIRRRLNLIPFTFTVPEADRDVQLPEKLKPEYPAILRWAIDGTLLWRKLGLAAPKSVRVATDDYLAAEDTFGAWLAECTKPSSFGREDTADLFAAWRKYCERTGEQPGTEKKFRGKMDGRFTPKHHPVTRRAGFEGIELVRADYSDDPQYGG